jgi:hypothetical protein
MGRTGKKKGKSDTESRQYDPSPATSSAADPAGPPHGSATAAAGAHPVAHLVPGLLRQAWIGLAFWMTFGLLLEGLIGYRIPDYLNDPQRRELFRLAHAHGNVLSLILLASALGLAYGMTEPSRISVWALRIGVVVMPLSFLLAGIWHYSNDPGLAIWLVPAAALLVIFGIVGMALGTRKR